mgnify:CR=1 FL=1
MYRISPIASETNKIANPIRGYLIFLLIFLFFAISTLPSNNKSKIASINISIKSPT